MAMSKGKKILIIVGSLVVALLVVVVIVGIMALPELEKVQEKSRETEAKALLVGMFTSAHIVRAETGQFPASCKEAEFSMDLATSGTELFYRVSGDTFEMTARAAKTETIYHMDHEKSLKPVDTHLSGPGVVDCVLGQ